MFGKVKTSGDNNEFISALYSSLAANEPKKDSKYQSFWHVAHCPGHHPANEQPLILENRLISFALQNVYIADMEGLWQWDVHSCVVQYYKCNNC